MGNFFTTYNLYIKPIEGGYVNNALDRGGETYAGIARRFWPNVSIWPTIDAIKAKAPIKTNAKFPSLEPTVTKFYEDMWLKNSFDKIVSQPIVDIFFDWFVNSGSAAISGVQKIVKVPITRKLDAATLAAINKENATELNNKIKQERIDFYNRIVARDPSQKVFINGWMNRINAFPTLTKVGGGIAGLLLLGGLFFLGYKYFSE